MGEPSLGQRHQGKETENAGANPLQVHCLCWFLKISSHLDVKWPHAQVFCHKEVMCVSYTIKICRTKDICFLVSMGLHVVGYLVGYKKRKSYKLNEDR